MMQEKLTKTQVKEEKVLKSNFPINIVGIETT